MTKLGIISGSIQGVEVDTGYFLLATTAKRPSCKQRMLPVHQALEVADANYKGWTTILPPQACSPKQRRAWKFNNYDPTNSTPYTHVRLLTYPDGGFGRLRIYGHAIPPTIESTSQSQSELPSKELSSALLGGLTLAASDHHFTPCSNLLLPGRGKDMGDGWNTASRRLGHGQTRACGLCL